MDRGAHACSVLAIAFRNRELFSAAPIHRTFPPNERSFRRNAETSTPEACAPRNVRAHARSPLTLDTARRRPVDATARCSVLLVQPGISQAAQRLSVPYSDQVARARRWPARSSLR